MSKFSTRKKANWFSAKNTKNWTESTELFSRELASFSLLPCFVVKLQLFLFGFQQVTSLEVLLLIPPSHPFIKQSVSIPRTSEELPLDWQLWVYARKNVALTFSGLRSPLHSGEKPNDEFRNELDYTSTADHHAWLLYWTMLLVKPFWPKQWELERGLHIMTHVSSFRLEK